MYFHSTSGFAVNECVAVNLTSRSYALKSVKYYPLKRSPTTASTPNGRDEEPGDQSFVLCHKRASPIHWNDRFFRATDCFYLFVVI
jgi:hypothetical protein